MSTTSIDQIISDLEQQRAAIQAALDALHGLGNTSAPEPAEQENKPHGSKHSDAFRAKQRRMMRKRWKEARAKGLTRLG